jgi:SAM-dependent methyltransferase
LWRQLAEVLDKVAGTPAVLDCGGGSGSLAVPLAIRGAQVTVVDISIDALATLQRRAAEAGVAAQVRAVQGDVEDLSATLRDAADGFTGDDGFDLVLAHGILSELDDLPGAVAAMAAVLRRHGVLSVLSTNPAAAVLARVVAGDLAGARNELLALRRLAASSQPDPVRAACEAAGLEVFDRHGVGVLAEFVPGSALDAPGAADALAELEDETADQAPFIDIASRVHLLARRPS